MALSRFEKDMSIIQALDDQPNDVGGLTAAELKAKFDEGGAALQEFINETLLAELEDMGASSIGASVDELSGETVQGVLESMKILVDSKASDAETEAALGGKAETSVTNLHIKEVSFNAEDGKFTFTKENGAEVVIDTLLEKVAVNFSYDAETEELVLTLGDGTVQRVSLSALISPTDFTQSNTIAWSVNGGTVSATVREGSITDDMLNSALKAMLVSYVTAVESSATAAQASANAAQSSATDASTSRTNAAAAASAAAASATSASASASAAYSAQVDAEAAKNTAVNARIAAENARTTAQSWAVGGTLTREGEDTNNAKYWSDRAQDAAGGGVSSFNGRVGVVVPQSGDYTAAMVGADSAGSAAAVQANLTAHASDAHSHGGLFAAKADLVGGKVPAAQLPAMDYVPTTRKVNGQPLSSDVTLYTFGTDELTPLVSALETGKLYFQYE